MVRSLCCSKGLKGGTWNAEEDMILYQYIRIHGAGGWKTLPQKAGLKRCGKSCRFRSLNYLRPDIKRGNMSPDEEELIILMHQLLGNRWSLIAGRLPGRTDNEIKNYWKTHLSKTLSVNQSQGKTRQNLEPRSKSRRILQNHVIKTTPARITTEVKLYAMDHAIKLPGTTQIMSVSKSGCNLPANDSITEDNVAVMNSDVNVGETEIRNFTCSMSTLPDQGSPDCKRFAGDAYVTGQNLCYLKELSSTQLNLLCSPSTLWADFGWEEFRTEPATSLGPGTKKYEGICSDDSFQFPKDQGSEEIYDHMKPVDWIHELDYI